MRGAARGPLYDVSLGTTSSVDHEAQHRQRLELARQKLPPTGRHILTALPLLLHAFLRFPEPVPLLKRFRPLPALLVGAATPLLSALLTGMPPMARPRP